MSTPPSELKVITLAKNLNSYLFKILDNAPKKFRGKIIARLEDNSLNLVECLVRANTFPLARKNMNLDSQLLNRNKLGTHHLLVSTSTKTRLNNTYPFATINCFKKQDSSTLPSCL